MSRLTSDLKNFGRQYIRSKTGAFFALIFPVLLILVFGAIFSGLGSSNLSMPVQNLDGGVYADALIEIMNRTNALSVWEIPANEDIVSYMNNNSLTIALVIPANFTAEVMAKQNATTPGTVNLTLYGDPSKSTFGTAQGIIRACLTNLDYTFAGATPLMGLNTENPGSTQKFNTVDFYIPGIIGMTVMTNALFAMTSTVAEYKQRSYFKLLATTNINRAEWLVAKFVFFTLLLIGAMLLTYLVAKVAFNIESSLTPMSFVFIAAGAFTFTSLGMAVGSLVKDPEGAVAIANAIGFPMMFLSGSFFPLEIMPDYMQAIASVLPLTYVNNGLRDTMIYANDSNALIALGVVMVFGIVFFLLASKMMSWKEK